MSMAAGPRHESTLQQNVSDQTSHKEREMTDADQSADKFFTFTIDASTGQVVKFEVLDRSGARRELSDEEKANLASEGSDRLEQALEEAFEAGIDCILGNEDGHDDNEESDQDAQLRHLLLTPLFKHSSARRLLRREVLSRVILGTLIQHSMQPHPAAAAGSPTSGLESDRSAATRAN